MALRGNLSTAVKASRFSLSAVRWQRVKGSELALSAVGPGFPVQPGYRRGRGDAGHGEAPRIEAAVGLEEGFRVSRIVHVTPLGLAAVGVGPVDLPA